MNQGINNNRQRQWDPSSSYRQFGYDSYDRIPLDRGNFFERAWNGRLAMKLRTPVYGTAALLLVGAAFAGVLMTSYPGEDSAGNIPVIKAETTAFKEAPEDRGGMNFPNEDSTVFDGMRSAVLNEQAPIENLLEIEEPLDRGQALANATPDQIVVKTDEDALADADPVLAEEAALESAMADDKAASAPTETALKAPQVNAEASAAEPVSEQVAALEKPAQPAIEVQEVMQSVESIAPSEVAQGAAADAKPPSTLHAAGSSPETLAYVRSVLEQKDNKPPAPSEAAAQDSAAVEPAAGAASVTAAAIAPGDYYIQLASISAESAAPAEWKKLQSTFPGSLQNVGYRVERADLGAKGVFFRIQAGPMSKESAASLCESIKAQKPGGCLVTR